jgi:RNA polymerase sigma-54 factor
LNNGDVPQLRVSRSFKELLDEYSKNRKNMSREQKDAYIYSKQKVDAAQNFINAIRQRQETLMKTMTTIVALQRTFFEEGDESLLHPMILKDVAVRTGLDISTISRVSNSKYVQTDFGVFPLKFFFNDTFVTKEGEELSKVKIKTTLKELISSEDKADPLSDEMLAAMLKKKGYAVARRTVAKYREQLGIPVARLRK